MIIQLYRRSRLRLPRLSYASVIGNEPITIIEPVDKPGGLTLEELAIVVGIAKTMGKCSFFELGAFRGRTTVNLVQNCPKCKITTFDLPLHALDDAQLEYSLLPEDLEVAKHDERGFFFKKYAEFEDRIVHLYGDSATFDFKPYHSSFDVVLVDGSHRYENVLIDSQNAFKLVRKGSGIILWHDYSLDHLGVVRAVHEIQKKNDLQIFHIKRTKLAYLAFDGAVR